MYTADQILTLARAYGAEMNISLATVGVKALKNDKIFRRLAAGKGCSTRSIERAALWFQSHWPDDLPWPRNVPRPRPLDAAA
jgi:hypothetical protein